ncbi:MAG: tetratricopeptide repeat protein [Verrucomicrobiales bacterium]|nr:tetratricopeptide repeat protein [Verrucomicrobiales bacterium]
MHPKFIRAVFLALMLSLAGLEAEAQSARARKDKSDVSTSAIPATAPVSFAPVAPDHPLASLWNDPEFTRRLLGSYGFLSEAEPRLSAEEQAVYRDRIVPLLREDPRKAIPELESALKPGASAVFDYTLGTIYFQSEDFTNAVKHYEQALAKFPDYRRAQRNLGLALVRDGKYEAAVKPLTRTVALGGGDGRIFGLLGFVHLSASRFVSAESAYKQAAVFEPENLEFKLGLVKACVGTGNLDAAIAMLDELLQQNPEKENLWALQANVFLQKEKPLKAIVNLEILRKMDKATAAQLSLLGDLYLTQDSRDLALASYLAALDKDGGKNPARGLRPAEILASRGAVAEAGQLLEKMRAGEKPAGEEELRFLKLDARVAMAAGDAERGIRILEEVVERSPLDGEALLLAGDHYARNGQPEKAEFRYDAAGKLEKFAPDALLKHAQLKVQQQKYPQAVELLRRAQKLKPRDTVARYLERVEQVAARARS